MTDIRKIRILVNKGLAMGDRYTFLFPNILNIDQAVALRDELQYSGKYYDVVQRINAWINVKPEKNPDSPVFYKAFFDEMVKTMEALKKEKVKTI